jgi:hypothetical protein
MQIKKSLVAVGVLASVGLVGVNSTGMVSAATGASSNSLVFKIAQKFNLNQDDVQAVFDAEKAQKDAERQAELSTRLQTAVNNSQITGTQKTLIENKLKELRAAREAERAALEAWAKEKDLDIRYLMGRPQDSDLQTLVDEGKITAEQKAAIEAKRAELQDKREAARSALQQWAKDNIIDQKYLKMGGGSGLKGGNRQL